METAQMKQEGKKRLTSLQARFGALETEARGRLVKALGAGQHRLTELDEILAKWSREDWSVEGMRKRFDTLRARAEQLRETALKRVNEIPGSAVTALANGSRVPVQNLARELERLAKLVEQPKPEDGGAVQPIPPDQKPARARPQKVEA
jgi:hypothetical protein